MGRINLNTVRKGAFFWAIALFVIAGPLSKEYSAGAVLHRTPFLIFAPLLIAILLLMLPAKPTASIASPVFGGKYRARIWVQLALMLAVFVLLMAALAALNDPSASHGDGNNIGLSMSLILMLIIFIHDIWKSIRALKKLN